MPTRTLLTCLALAVLSTVGGCRTPLVERAPLVILENRTGTTIATAMVRYGGETLSFANIEPGDSRRHHDPYLGVPEVAVVQWIGADGSHFIKSVGVRNVLPRRYSGGVRFVAHPAYVEVALPPE